MTAPRPLEGLKVLELSRLLPGPYAGLVLADLGASVVKVEDPRGGDPLRGMPPQVEAGGALFLALNRDKRSLALDLKTPEGAEALRRLVRRYDVLIEGFRPGVMERLGLSYEALRRENRGLVYCSVSGYGQTGPDRLRAGHDLNYVGRAGLLGLTGEADGIPAMPGGQVGDIGGALFALIGLLSALVAQRTTGEGRHVDVSMTESALAFVHMPVAARLLAGTASGPLRRGREPLLGGHAQYRVYRTADGKHLSVAALEAKFFSRLCEAIGRPDLLSRLADPAQDPTLRGELEVLFASRSQAEWLALLGPADLCVEPVSEGDELFCDPQLQAREMFPRDASGQRHVRTPLATAPFPLRRAPSLGEHTREVLEEAGFTPSEMQRLGVAGG